MPLKLKQKFATASGYDVDASWWRWIGLNIDSRAGIASVTLAGYVSKKAFEDGKQPVGSKTFNVGGADFIALITARPTGATLADVLSNAIYAHARAKDTLFSDADNDATPVAEHYTPKEEEQPPTLDDSSSPQKTTPVKKAKKK